MNNTSLSDPKSLGFEFVKERKGIHEFRLTANGLKVLLIPNHSAPVVTTMIVYHVGSRNEAVGYTGSTHFLEHMMFKGTTKFKNFDRVLNPVGADFNATTYYDRTNYFAKVPRAHLKLVLALEADRMRNLVLKKEDRDSEMTVVRNEFENGKNSPFSLLLEEMAATAFFAHSYHHPVIGWLSDVENVPLERMQAFYDQFYWPNNATLMVTGDVTIDEALALIAAEFGGIPASPHPIPAVYTVEPEQLGERRLTLEKPSTDPAIVLIGNRVPGASHKDYYALSAISSILGGSGKSASRLNKSMIETGIAVEAFCFGNELKDEFLFRLGAFAAPGAELAAVEKALLAELDHLKTDLVTDAELARVKKSYRKGLSLSVDNQMSLLSTLCDAEVSATWEELLDAPDRMDAVTAEEIREVARRYFNRATRTVGVFLPQDIDGGDAPEGDNKAKNIGDGNADAPASDSAKEGGFEALTVEKVFPNGLTVQVVPKPEFTTVACAVRVRAGDNFGPADKPMVPDFTAEMLTKGAKHATKVEMAEALEEMGSDIAFGTDKFAVATGGKVVPEDFGVYFAYVADCLRNPLFPAEELTQVREKYRSDLLQGQSDISFLSNLALKRKLFAPGTTHYAHTPEELLASLDAITVEDLKAFHAAHFTPKSTLVTIVGNITPEQAFHAVEITLASWQGGEAAEIKVDKAPEAPAKAEKIVVSVPGKTSVAIKIGLPAPVKVGTDEYFVARMASDALGENTLSARLGLVVREKHGLTYGINSGFDGADWGEGLWKISLTVNPKNVDKALGLVNEVLETFLKEGVGEEELAGWISNRTGSFDISLDNPLSMAKTLNSYSFIGLGPRYLDRLGDGYRAVTKEAVDAYARANFDPSKMVTVIVGSV